MALAGRLRSLVARRRPPIPVLIGHSHTKSVFEAAEAEQFALAGYNFWTAPQPAIDDARSAFHPEIAAALASGPVFSLVGGSAHNMLGLVRHPRPFDFILPGRGDLPLDPQAEIVPFAAIRETMARSVADYLEILELVRATSRGPVYHVEAPPPLEDDRRVHADIPWLFFGDLTREVSPAALRYKCWRLHSELVEAFCAQAGIETIAVPDEAVTPTGYLEPALYLDAMHVNAHYGALVLAQIKQRL